MSFYVCVYLFWGGLSLIDSKKKTFLINTLRRASFRWKPKGEAEKKFKVPIGEFKTGRIKYGYKCAKCGEINKKKDTNTDHIIPVVPLEGWDSLDGFADRLLCDEDGYQVLCVPCHDTKTAWEKSERLKFRKLKKNA